MTIDSSIKGIVETFLYGESVFLNYFASEIQKIISSFGNFDAVFALMVVILALWYYSKTPITFFLEWLWFNRNPFDAPLDDNENIEEQYTGKTWGAKYMQTTVIQAMDAGSLFLLQIVSIMFVIKVFDYWATSQYSVFDAFLFTAMFILSIYAFVGVMRELQIKL